MTHSSQSAQAHLDAHIASVQRNAQIYQEALISIRKIGLQGTWLGSRKLGANTLEYQWTAAAAEILARRGYAAKTGAGPGLMEAPHLGCVRAGRPDLSIGVHVEFLASDEPVNTYVKQGTVLTMPDLSARHDVLFIGSSFYVVLPGRLGTVHEKFDLLNRLKHHQLAPEVPVFFVDREGYWEQTISFMVEPVTETLGARISEKDFARVQLVDLTTTSPEQFAERLFSQVIM